MFERQLAEKFKAIFGVSKVSYDEPGESQEQKCLFVEIETSRNRLGDGVERARVNGKIVMFAQNDQIPFGFFSKAIAKAPPSLTADLFFFDFEENSRRYQNVVQRSCSFVYFFTGQYDPDIGTLDEIEFIEEPEA